MEKVGAEIKTSSLTLLLEEKGEAEIGAETKTSSPSLLLKEKGEAEIEAKKFAN